MIFKSEEEKDFSVIDQVEQILSLLRIHAFPVNKNDMANLFAKILRDTQGSTGWIYEAIKQIMSDDEKI